MADADRPPAPRSGALKRPILSTGVGNGLRAIGILESAANGTKHIGKDYYQEAAVAVGMRCNRVFGSGHTTPA